MAYEVQLLEPAEQFLNELEVKLRAKTFPSLALLEHFGPRLPMPHAKQLVDHDLYELRVRQGSNSVRLFYFFEHETIIVVTSGYRKKSDRTDRREIERALRLEKRHLNGGRI